MSGSALLLLLADGRFPAGGYAHSGGLEPSVTLGTVRDLASLAAFLEGRVRTTGFVAAAFAAAAVTATAARDAGRLGMLDVELDARMPSPAQRATSRQLGRQLLRTLQAVAPSGNLDLLGPRPHQPVVLGAGAAVLGLGPREAAAAVLHEAVAGPAAAAVRLLSLDPFQTHAILVRVGPLLDELADGAARCSSGDAEDLPAWGAPLLDLAAEEHQRREGRLFAS
ncbi:MAG: urease accessory protein UreF [Intrasporangium sp.]|uniref:urease accessory protein UreF n=1 Tax=Intrasporangium sp. TaxID=1925024 RepID=UPI003F7EA093